MSKEKTNFTILNKLEGFYTNGKIHPTSNGKYILCCCSDKINFFNISSGLVEFFIVHEDALDLTSFILTPDDLYLITANKGGLLRQWKVEKKSLTRQWRSDHRGPISCMDIDSTSTLLATGSADSTVKVWDLDKQYCTNFLKGHSGVISIIKFNPKNSYNILTSSDDYKIKLWDLVTHACLLELSGHYSLITSLQYSNDSKYLYSSSRDRVIHIWNLENPSQNKKTIAVYECIEAMILIPKNSDEAKSLKAITQPTDDHILIAGSKGKLSLWNTSTFHCVLRLDQDKSSISIVNFEEKKSNMIEEEIEEKNTNGFTQCCHVKSLKSIIAVTADQNIIFYDIMEDFNISKQFSGNNEHVLDLKFFGPSDSHFAVATNSNRLKVYEVSSWACRIYEGHQDIIVCMDTCFIYDKYFIITGSKDNSLILWEFDSKSSKLKLIAKGHGHTHTINCVAFIHLTTNNGAETLFTASGSSDKTLKLWKISLAKCKDASLMNQSDKKLKACLTIEGHEKDINSIAVSPDNKLIATGSKDRTAKLWNRIDLSLLGTFKGHKRGIWCVYFSKIDRILATSSADATIKLWDLNTFTCIRTFEGHESTVLRINFLCRGMQVVSCGSDGLIKLWTVKTSECVKTIDAHNDKIWAMCVNSNEDRIVSGSGDGSIIMWKDVSEEEKLETLNKSQDLKLKEQELMNLLHGKHYVKALALAISLDQPSRALMVIKEIMKSNSEDMKKSLSLLRDDQIEQLLSFAVVWNQNAKNCHVGQYILNYILKRFHPDRLLEFANIQTLIEGFLPYTERHFTRMNQLIVKSTFANFVWHTMKLSDLPLERIDKEKVEKIQIIESFVDSDDSAVEMDVDNNESSIQTTKQCTIGT